MDMKGEARIPAPQSVVWDALNDPEALKEAITGCEELERDGENAFKARVRAKVGPVSAKFGGRVELQDLNPPHSYRIAGEGTGGAAGFAKGGALVELEADGPDATILKYDVDASVGGKLAQIGSRLIDGAARKMADDFFTKFGAIAAARAEAAAPAPVADPTPAAPQQQAEPAPAAPVAPAAIQSAPAATAPLQPAAQWTPPVQASAAEAPARVEPSPRPAPPTPEPPPAPEPAPPESPAQQAADQSAATSSTEALIAEDAAAEASRPAPRPDPSGGMPGIMWVAGIGLLVAILLFTLMG